MCFLLHIAKYEWNLPLVTALASQKIFMFNLNKSKLIQIIINLFVVGIILFLLVILSRSEWNVLLFTIKSSTLCLPDDPMFSLITTEKNHKFEITKNFTIFLTLKRKKKKWIGFLSIMWLENLICYFFFFKYLKEIYFDEAKD